MKIEKTCKKCDKQYPPNIVFCPDCGSLTRGPDAPVEASPAHAARPKRTSKGLHIRSLPTRSLPPRIRKEHSREDFFQALVKNDVPEQDVEVIKRLMEWAESISGSASFGDSILENGRVGFRPTMRWQDKEVNLFWISTDGRVEVHFDDWIHLSPFDSREKRVEMLSKLNGIKGVRIPESKIADRPPIPVRMLREKNEYDKFIGTYEWFIALVRGQ